MIGFRKPKTIRDTNTVPPVTVRPGNARTQYLDIISRKTRMPSMTDPRAIGPCFYAANQTDQIDYLGSGYDGRGSYQADPSFATPVSPGWQDGPQTPSGTPAFATAGRTTRHPDGTCDSVRLQATGDGWIDAGGPTPRDVKVVNW